MYVGLRHVTPHTSVHGSSICYSSTRFVLPCSEEEAENSQTNMTKFNTVRGKKLTLLLNPSFTHKAWASYTGKCE